MKAPPPGTQSTVPLSTLKHSLPGGGGGRVALGDVDLDRGLYAGEEIAVVGLARILRRDDDLGGPASRHLDQALVVDDRRRGKRRMVDLGRDPEGDEAFVRSADAVEIAGGNPEIGNRCRIVRICRGADRCTRQRSAGRIRAVAGHIDVDDLETSRELVLEVHLELLQSGHEVRIGKALRIAAQAEAQGIDDVVAASLSAFLGEEGHNPVRPRIDDARIVEVELKLRADRDSVFSEDLHRG